MAWRFLAGYAKPPARPGATKPLPWSIAIADDDGEELALGADKAYDVEAFVQALKDRSVTPHIAVDGHLSKTGKPRKTAIDNRTLRHAGYAISQRCRKRIEEVFGWIKAQAGLAKVKFRGRGSGGCHLHNGVGGLQSDLLRSKLLAVPL